MLRDHLPDNFLPPPSIQTYLTESDQGNFVGNSLAYNRGGFPFFPLCPVFLYINKTGDVFLGLCDTSTQSTYILYCR